MLYSLLERGYLPRELPPLFGSESFAAIAKIKTELPESMTQKKADWTQPMHHNLARVGGLRRRLTVPNPINYFRLAAVFDKHKAVLMAEWQKSSYSQTVPKVSTRGTRGLSNEPIDRAAARAHARIGAKYLLCADISQFYPSIYTHTIPWALHTKNVAKAAFNDMSLVGNVIDKELQACHFGQTKGIAIGPDTSLGIAELLLAQIDCRLKKECQINRGVRFIDDMEFGFQNLAKAEAALACLEKYLYEYELQLNGNKTRIIELPDTIESSYVTKLRTCLPHETTGTPSQWIDYFNHAFILARAHSSDGVLRYAVASLQSVTSTGKCWKIAQSLLWQCIALDPGCLRFVIDILLLNKHRAAHIPDVAIASEAIESLILSSASVGHGSEVLWSIWASLQLELTLSAESQAAISEMDDTFVAVAAMRVRDKGVFASTFESALWTSWLVEGCFSQEHWLFAYESYKRGWFPDKVLAAKLPDDLAVKFLGDNGVTFINDRQIESYHPSRLVAYGSGGGY